ncbi:uncharacterized protein LOC130567092 [Triplophysa rosa]|uniref:THAP-type domain-containing protein n=1 Tax=Triplophysa rosa TaxID=992332 RepID=A0A9W7WJ05_TRIRA|nr:uncharacterized protein LOC130567092 [Triplophysa rosa]KAI7799173.1 hypothetical protein IRJ41_020349 [Triplophysa rosa]
MAQRKCVFECEGKKSLFRFPKNPDLRQQWMRIVFPGQKRSCENVYVCYQHFADDCFTNKAQFEAGFANRLQLDDGAVPTIKYPVQETELQASTSTSQAMPSIKHTECQTEHRPAVSVEVQANPLKSSVGTQCRFTPLQKTTGTQFSFSKHTGHLRSKGTQTTDLSASMETSQVNTRSHLPSTPIKASTSGLGARPAKRPRMELPEEDEEDISDIPQPHDCTNEPGDSAAEPSEISGVEVTCDYTDAKYIVFESSLRELFETCPLCKRNCDVQRRRLGTFVSFSQVCENCQYNRKWQSQPVKGSTPVGNLQMSAAVYFTGGSFIQTKKICRAMNLQIHQYKTFRRHARLFLEPSIYHKWRMDQQAMFQQLQPQGEIPLSGDMRAVSPGRFAKYGSYTLMHLKSNKILDIQLLQSIEVGGSAHMEKEGLSRGLELLESNQLHVDYIVTDRNTQVQNYLRERNVKQYYDVWHLEKELSKKLDKLSRNCKLLRKWSQGIKNHMYWSAMSSKEGPKKVAKWKSLLNHIQNVHTHDDPLFPKCAHPERVSRDTSKWFRPGTMVLHNIEKLLLNKRILEGVAKLSHQHQTSAFGAFHSVILRFASKNVVYPFIGMLCRLYLAAMHFNENADREQEGTAVYRIMHPKSRKEQSTAKPVKTEPTFEYISDLMRLLFLEVFDKPDTFVEELRKVPVPGLPISAV